MLVGHRRKVCLTTVDRQRLFKTYAHWHAAFIQMSAKPTVKECFEADILKPTSSLCITYLK